MSRHTAARLKNVVYLLALALSFLLHEPLTRTVTIALVGAIGMYFDRIERQCMEQERSQARQSLLADAITLARLESADGAIYLASDGAAQETGD